MDEKIFSLGVRLPEDKAIGMGAHVGLAANTVVVHGTSALVRSERGVTVGTA
jgi:hypothetical protein